MEEQYENLLILLVITLVHLAVIIDSSNLSEIEDAIQSISAKIFLIGSLPIRGSTQNFGPKDRK